LDLLHEAGSEKRTGTFIIDGYSVSSGGDRPSESISMNFTKIEYKYTPFDDQHKAGTPVPVTYDLATAVNK
jgi:type VI secretion system secreted protein Hcp